MNERRTETTTIERKTRDGRVIRFEYAKVADRLQEFHADSPVSIVTLCDFKEGWVIFEAVATNKKGSFTGHSFGKVSGRDEKAFEKLETIAVGRALAFAGYLADGAIATAEEMEEFEDRVTEQQLNGLKQKFAKVYAARLSGLEQPECQSVFNCWCREVIGEDVSYHDPNSWERSWYETAWKALIDSEPPFEAE